MKQLRNLHSLELIVVMALFAMFSTGEASAETNVVKKKDLPEYIKSEAQGKLKKIVVFTAKSGKYKIAAITREKAGGKLESRMIAYELLKSVKLPSVIRSTKWQPCSDFKFTEVEKWQFNGNPALIVEKKLDDTHVKSEVYVFKGPDMKQVNALSGEKVALEDKNKDEVVLSLLNKGDSQSYKWNGEKLVKF